MQQMTLVKVVIGDDMLYHAVPLDLRERLEYFKDGHNDRVVDKSRQVHAVWDECRETSFRGNCLWR